MLELIKRPANGIYSNGSCNYCSRGKMKKYTVGFNYPYDYVLEIKGDSISTRICPDCYEKLIGVKFEEVPVLANERDKNSIKFEVE